MAKKLSFLNNRLSSNLDYSRGKVRLSGYPVEITIELTNWCDLDCVFCPHAKMKRKQGFIEFSLFKKIIDEIAGRVECVDLDLMGESAAHPELFKIIQYCKQSGLKTVLNSNMSNIDHVRAKQLADSGLDLLVMSIDGLSKGTYESLRRGASYETTRANIENLLKIKPTQLCKVVQMVYVKPNADEAARFLKQWRGKGADFIRVQPYQNIERQNMELSVYSNSGFRRDSPCIHPWKKIAVCWDGDVVLCCNDYDKFKVVGNVRGDRILDIWNGERMQELRSKLIARDWQDLIMCENCASFYPGKAILWGGVFVNPVQVRKLLFVFERLMVFKGIRFFRYS